MEYVSYELTRYMYRLGFRKKTMWRYYEDESVPHMAVEEALTTAKKSSLPASYPAPTVMDAVDFLWSKDIAKIYPVEARGSVDLSPVLRITEGNRVYRPSIEFKTPGPVYKHCIEVFTDSEVTKKHVLL